MQVPIEFIELLDNGDFPCGKTSVGGLKCKVLFHEGTFAEIASLDNLFLAWKNYCKGKRSKGDVKQFEFRREDNIFQLHTDLVTGQYQPGSYQQFRITDPKPRVISKAPIRDRLLHQAIYQILYPEFDRTFIFDSYSCRNKKGTHCAFQRLVIVARKVSCNYKAPCWAIKMDIKKFFDSVDHEILIGLLGERIVDKQLMKLLEQVVGSFSHTSGTGMPLGNLTSQLFANVYMDLLDKYIKHKLKVKDYMRYADDFIVLSPNSNELLGYLVEINIFLKTNLKLHVHPNKVVLRKLSQGVDFVGYVALPHYNLPRLKTVKRILRKITSDSDNSEIAIPSYLGYLGHVSSYEVTRRLFENLGIEICADELLQ